jgi:hypothetical protein
MRLEVHVHADIPILEGVSKRQLEQAFAPLLEYLDADNLADVKSLEADEPGIKYDEKELLLAVCWTGEIGRSFHGALEAVLDNLGPYCYEAVEVDVTLYLENGEQESRLMFVGPTALVNELFDRDWKEKASKQKKTERAFETYTRPSRKNLH